VIQMLIGCSVLCIILSPGFIYFIISKKKINNNKYENYMSIFNSLGRELQKQNKFLENKLEKIDYKVKKNNLVLEKLFFNKN